MRGDRLEAVPDLVAVAVALFDSPHGTLAEDWLEWHKDRISFSEEAISKSSVQALEQGLRESRDHPTRCGVH